MNASLRRQVLAGGGPLVFVHIPKTAGTTFRKEILLPIFRRREVYHVYDKIRFYRTGSWQELANAPQAFRNSLCLVAGHMPFDADDLFRQPRYLTFLREPIDRVVSDYFYCRQDPESAAHDLAKELDLAEFCRRGYSQTHNCQTRYLSNRVFGAEYASDAAMLAAAKGSIDRCFFFGLTERFADSVALFFHKIGYDGKVNDILVLNPSRRPEDIGAEAHAVLARYNALDLELYAYARDRFEAQCREPGPLRSSAAG